MILKAPFPWFGGKSRVAPIVWERFGDTTNYVEPFAGSLAVMLGRPHAARVETVNDLDCYLANFWRAVQADPEAVAFHADWPVNETDLRSRHLWLVNEGRPIADRLLDDPDFYDPRIAGWWVWGISMWIGGGWCTTYRANQKRLPDGNRKGVHRQQPWQIKPHLSSSGVGVHKKRPHLMTEGRGVISQERRADLLEYMQILSERLRYVRICCGDWARVVKPSVTVSNGLTGVLLDPPYPEEADRDMRTYGVEDGTVAHAAWKWAVDNGDNPQLRIALCGYEGTHTMPDGWTVVEWESQGGYSSLSKTKQRGKDNRKRERIWFSPHCLKPQLTLFNSMPASLEGAQA